MDYSICVINELMGYLKSKTAVKDSWLVLSGVPCLLPFDDLCTLLRTLPARRSISDVTSQYWIRTMSQNKPLSNLCQFVALCYY
jgi:hypothetical protein